MKVLEKLKTGLMVMLFFGLTVGLSACNEGEGTEEDAKTEANADEEHDHDHEGEHPADGEEHPADEGSEEHPS